MCGVLERRLFLVNSTLATNYKKQGMHLVMLISDDAHEMHMLNTQDATLKHISIGQMNYLIALLP
jgi:hypothetical protein